MMKIIHRFIMLLLMVLAAQPVYASRMGGEAVIFLLGIFALFVLLGIIFLGLIITSTVLLIQRRSTPARRKYGKVAKIISYILMLPLPLFFSVMLIVSGGLAKDIWEGIALVLVACAIAIVPGGLSAFLAHKVNNLPAENSEG
jgi:multisubunit Na+/H+ antiporter MnhE subunit